jgi:hypothetical protein
MILAIILKPESRIVPITEKMIKLLENSIYIDILPMPNRHPRPEWAITKDNSLPKSWF